MIKQSSLYVTWHLKGLCINVLVPMFIVHVLSQTASGIDSNDLVLTNVTLEDSGVYTCYAASTLGSTSKSAWLAVVQPRCKLCLISCCLCVSVLEFLPAETCFCQT